MNCKYKLTHHYDHEYCKLGATLDGYCLTHYKMIIKGDNK